MATLLTMPRLSQDMESGTIVDWLKKEGDRVERGQVILVVETDKAESDVEAPESGVIRRILAPVGTQVLIGEPLAVIAAESEQDWEKALPGAASAPAATAVPTAVTASAAPAAAAHAAAPSGGRRPASPAAKRVAKELGVDIALVTGTGEGGLVGEADVHAFAERSTSGAAPAAPAATTAPAAAADEEIERIPLEGMRRRIADRMTLSRQSAADVTTVIDVDMDPVARVRKQTGLSYTTYVAWAVAHSLLEFPDVNATFVDETILRRRRVNLGVAVALGSGLIVPVVRGAETMTPEQIDAEVQRLAALARDGKIAPADLSGGSFTLTNSGTFGSLFFTPIINVPEVAILGVGRVADVPVIRDGQVVPGKVMYLCLSYDHRVVDGATAVQFLAAVKQRLQEIEAGMGK